jgi:virginiamycin B lyase
VFDPKGEQWKRYEIDAGTHPHNLIVAQDGGVWYSGNRNARIARLDAASGQVKTFMMPDTAVRDPHTLIFDGRGNILFTAQQAGYVGRLNMASGKIDVLKPAPGRTLPYGIRLDSKGKAWVNLFGTNQLALFDPVALTTKVIDTPRADARTRRIEVTPDDMVWYVDYAQGRLGRYNPVTSKFDEWPIPGGERSQPYAMEHDEKGRIWIAECARGATHIVGFDPKTQQFIARTPVSNCIRHMEYHPATRAIWFGTDSNNIGRAILP